MGFDTHYNPTIVFKQGRDLATCTEKWPSTFFWMANLIIRMNNIKEPVGITAPTSPPQLLMMVSLGLESNEHLASLFESIFHWQCSPKKWWFYNLFSLSSP